MVLSIVNHIKLTYSVFTNKQPYSLSMSIDILYEETNKKKNNKDQNDKKKEAKVDNLYQTFYYPASVESGQVEYTLLVKVHVTWMDHVHLSDRDVFVRIPRSQIQNYLLSTYYWLIKFILELKIELQVRVWCQNVIFIVNYTDQLISEYLVANLTLTIMAHLISKVNIR